MKHRTFIVPAAVVATARAMCAGLAGPAGAGMFTTGLSATGAEPATHYISAGPISDDMAALLPLTTVDSEGKATTAPGNAALVVDLAGKAGIQTTEAHVAVLLAAVDVSDQGPFTALGRCGLKIVAGVP